MNDDQPAPRNAAWSSKKPPDAPTSDEQRSEEEWESFEKLASTELDRSVSVWREGLASTVSMAVATLLVVTAPSADGLTNLWRGLVLFALVLAAVSGVVGLWKVLVAAAGVPATITRKEFEQEYESVAEFKRFRHRKIAHSMQIARRAVLVSIVATLSGAAMLWIAPYNVEPSLRVQTETGSYCGSLLSADQGEIHLDIKGERDPLVIPIDAADNFWIVRSCS